MKIKILFAALLVSSLTSCVSYNKPITQPEVNRIQPGVTTEADLVKIFGPSDTKLTDNRQRVSLAWFRSLGPKPAGYAPLIGSAVGGLDVEVQQLSVTLGPSGRVSNFKVYDSVGDVQTEKTRSGKAKDIQLNR